MLDRYRERYRLYDWVLGEFSALLRAKYPDAAAIDIGANVGDTAALLCSRQPMPVLCVEGHPRFLPYLRRNVERLPPGVEVAECLVGARSGTVPIEGFAAHHGTATVTGTSNVLGGDTVLVRTLAELLEEHPRFRQARLLKIDTDGSDFEILASSLKALGATRPVLFFEYDPTLRMDGARAARETIDALMQAGYRRFLVSDNFGHFMGEVHGEVGEKFYTLDRYLFSHLYFGRMVYYLDVFAFPAADDDLCSELEGSYRLLVESAMHRDGRDF